MNALIFIAHGSRRVESNNEVIELVNSLRPVVATQYSHIEHAFLELVEPSLCDAISSVIAKEITSIAIYPYFLNTGNHVERDIPGILRGIREQNPTCNFTLLDHFGSSPDIVSLIAKQLN